MNQTSLISKRGLGWLLPALATLSLWGCPAPTVDPAYQKLAQQQEQLPTAGELGPGDKFTIRVFHEPEISGPFTVSPDGSIKFPYAGRISVLGKTCPDLEEEITKSLRNGYLNDPYVSCTITEYTSKQIFILGDVKKPGAYPYRSQSTIVEAIAIAGGFELRAERNQITLTRGDSQIPVEVPVQDIIEGKRKNINLLPGDIIFVPRSVL